MSGEECAALIVAEPGEFRESIRAMLTSIIPGVRILEADDVENGLLLLEQHHPSLIVADGSLPGQRTARLVDTARRLPKRARCSIMTDTVQQQALALASGADHSAIKGEPAPRLFTQLEQMLLAA